MATRVASVATQARRSATAARVARCLSGPLPPLSPWASAAATARRGDAEDRLVSRAPAPMLPEARKLLTRASSLVSEEYLRREEFEVAEHSALTATSVCAKGEIEIDDEKLQTLRKLVRIGVERKMHAAEHAIQGEEGSRVLSDVMDKPDSKFQANPSPPSSCTIS